MLTHNNSGRFECRFTSVKIPEQTPAIMLDGMKGSSFGVWVAHGEGQFVFQNEQIKNSVQNNISLVYVDDYNRPTTT